MQPMFKIIIAHYFSKQFYKKIVIDKILTFK